MDIKTGNSDSYRVKGSPACKAYPHEHSNRKMQYLWHWFGASYFYPVLSTGLLT